jgi:REP element-mobilizing transposase RayT
MSDRNLSTAEHEMYFVTLKVSVAIHENERNPDFFEQREFSDAFIKSLIYMIEKSALVLYGFVILSDQIHMIVSTSDNKIDDAIAQLKRISATEILRLISKKLNTSDEVKLRNHADLRNIFSRFLNDDVMVFWGGNGNLLPLPVNRRLSDIEAISGDVLFSHLADSERNYLQLGAVAFTKLMMETF